jgi:hypothetical protein
MFKVGNHVILCPHYSSEDIENISLYRFVILFRSVSTTGKLKRLLDGKLGIKLATFGLLRQHHKHISSHKQCSHF